MSFRVDTETRVLGPGESWRIPANTPHEVHVGPEGAVVVDVFTPARDDWRALEHLDAGPPRWP
ncbi:MAG: cupin domain-containing protein [Gaiellaceae bacterium]